MTDPTGMCERNGNTDAFCDIVENSEFAGELVDPVDGAISPDELESLEQQVDFEEAGLPWRMEGAIDAGGGARAYYEAEQARADAEGLPGNEGGEGDAVRHTSWNAGMTQALGEKSAKKFADSRERWSGNPTSRRTMDLINNNNGRVLGKIFPNVDQGTLAKAALNAGLLQTRPVVVVDPLDKIKG